MSTDQALLPRIGTASVPAERIGSAVRFEVLDSWRGICALLVALFHFPAASFVSQSSFIASSYLFVDFFFVLSGFVIAASYAGKLRGWDDGLRFAAIRLGRVYPLHVVMLAAFALFELVRLVLPQLRGAGGAPFSDPYDAGSLVANLLLVHGLGLYDHLTWNGPSWSISSEFFTYLAFAAVVIPLAGRAWIVLAAVAVAAPAMLYLSGARNMDLSYDWGFVRCAAGFSLGALIAHFQHGAIVAARRRPGDATDRAFWTVAEIAMVVAIVSFVAGTGDKPASIAAPFVFALAIYLFAHEGGAVSTLLRRPLFLWLGALSYSIYMVHTFVQGRLYNVFALLDRKLGLGIVGDVIHHGKPTVGFGPDSQAVALAAAAVMLAAVVAVAWLTWRFVEMPALAWTKRAVAGIAPRKAAVAG